MENLFDFYSVTAVADRIGELTRAGVARDKIHGQYDGWKVYGSRRFRRTVYRASLGYCPVVGGNPDAIAAPWREKGLCVHIQYHARD